MKMKHFFLALLLIAIVALTFHFSVVPDTFWHLRTGETMIREQAILKTDPFTFHSAGEEWQYPSLNWLSEIQMSAIYHQFGFAGLNVWVALIAILSLFFIYKSMSGHFYLRGAILLLLVISAKFYWGARPHIYSFLFTSIFIWILENYRLRKSNRLWLLPIIMMLWVNSHAGFPVGIVIFLIYLFGEMVSQLSEIFKDKKQSIKTLFTSKFQYLYSILTALFVSLILNPLGLETFKFPSKTLSIEALQDFIVEWQSPNFHEIGFWPFLFFVVLVIFAIAKSSKKLSFTESILLLGFGLLSLTAARNIYLFVLVAAPIVTHLLAPLFDEKTRSIKDFGKDDHSTSKLYNILRIVILVLALIAAVVQISPTLNEQNNLDFISEHYPVGASNQLGVFSSLYRILNSYNQGGYLIWSNPAQSVFIDGRTDFYGDEFISDWIQMVNLQDGWEETFEKWNFNIVMLEPYQPLIKILPYEGWKILFEDEQAVILIRSH